MPQGSFADPAQPLLQVVWEIPREWKPQSPQSERSQRCLLVTPLRFLEFRKPIRGAEIHFFLEHVWLINDCFYYFLDSLNSENPFVGPRFTSFSSMFDWLMTAFIIWNSNLVHLLEGLCTSNLRGFEFSVLVFRFLTRIEPTTSGLTVPRFGQLT